MSSENEKFHEGENPEPDRTLKPDISSYNWKFNSSAFGDPNRNNDNISSQPSLSENEATHYSKIKNEREGFYAAQEARKHILSELDEENSNLDDLASPQLWRRETKEGRKRSSVWAGALAGFLAAIAALAFHDVGAGVGQRFLPLQESGPTRSFEGETFSIGETLDIVSPSVVTITGGENNTFFGGAGTGVIIEESGIVLTNAHVIGGTNVDVLLQDGQTYRAELVGSFPEEDIGLLQITDPPEGLVPAILGDSDDLRVGDEVIAIGNALNLGGSPTVTKGIISSLNRNVRVAPDLLLKDLLQTDSAINRGNSGGPLVDSTSMVMGINTAIASEANNIGFAIPVNKIKPLIESIQGGGGTIRGDQAFLGVVSQYDERGIEILQVVPRSSAEKAGIKVGDLILRINGEEVQNSDELSAKIKEFQVGEDLNVEVLRDGVETPLLVTLGKRSEAG